MKITEQTKTLNNEPTLTTSSIELHQALGLTNKHLEWIRASIDNAGLVEGEDYLLVVPEAKKSFIANINKLEYFLTRKACMFVAMMTRGEVGNKVREHYYGLEQAALKQLQANYASALNQNKILNLEGKSSSKIARESNYLPIADIKSLLGLRTGNKAVGLLLDYYNVPKQLVGVRTYYSLKESIECVPYWLEDSELVSPVSTITRIHTFTGLTFEHS